MHPIVRDEVYRIGYEAIRNACAHSAARRVEISLEYGRDLMVRVSDNGIGMDTAWPNTAVTVISACVVCTNAPIASAAGSRWPVRQVPALSLR